MLFGVLLVLNMCVLSYAVVPETLSEGDITAFLSGHNKLRSSVNVQDLVWDSKLATIAEKYTSGCVRNETSTGYGETLFYSYPKVRNNKKLASEAIGFWASPVNFVKPKWECSIKSKTACGAATQLVWRKTTHIGCSIAHCSDNFENFVVCLYTPRGNIIGESPY
ncbi:unnamed protein product [Lymnaea stagnalis]|uniref:SCP domain-containing protein n=1 Tax=Lymnaea stagnalis TaxID=6523 RepID=A0AAV2I039_LYMST